MEEGSVKICRKGVGRETRQVSYKGGVCWLVFLALNVMSVVGRCLCVCACLRDVGHSEG